jgi:hypothetical protein
MIPQPPDMSKATYFMGMEGVLDIDMIRLDLYTTMITTSP